MKRAAIYVRVSSKEQAEGGYSIEAQQGACRRFVAERGWLLAGEYVDRGESARTADRPEFQRMLRENATDPAHFIVVHKIDRLARNVEDHVLVRGQLRKQGTRLVSVTEAIDESPMGRMMENIAASFAEWYSDNLGQEVRKGMTQKARNGIWPSTAPIGYRNVRTGLGRKSESVLEIDSETAPLVREAFELYATGQWTLTTLAAELEKRGLRTRNGKP
ncbi:MAG: recombinase family protein, partial [Nitriliruptorales bacterium]